MGIKYMFKNTVILKAWWLCYVMGGRGRAFGLKIADFSIPHVIG
jgi:hypothetical protein